jgi:hypothetical protein
VAVVLKAVPLGPSREERQYRIEPLERLDRGLLTHTEHRRMLRGFKYKPMISAAFFSKSGSSEVM